MGKKRPVHVEVKPRHRDEPVEKMIKRFSKKVKNERIIEGVLARKRFEKPSVKRRREKERKKRLLQKLHRERQLREEQR